MIKITYSDNEITAKGHANTAPKGQDLVCCAVSTLMYALIYNLERIGGPYHIKADEGYMNIKTDKEWAIEYTVYALRKVAEEYSNYIKIEKV